MITGLNWIKLQQPTRLGLIQFPHLSRITVIYYLLVLFLLGKLGKQNFSWNLRDFTLFPVFLLSQNSSSTCGVCFKLDAWDANRLAGAGLLAPVINYWWPSFPADLSRAAYNRQPLEDQWTLRVAHFMPWLTYWWNSQKLFPASSVIARNPEIYSAQDLEIVKNKLSIDPEREKRKVHNSYLYYSCELRIFSWWNPPFGIE